MQQRVRQGGHDIPEALIRRRYAAVFPPFFRRFSAVFPPLCRRFAAGLANFHQHYAPAVDAWALHNNAGEAPELLDWSER